MPNGVGTESNNLNFSPVTATVIIGVNNTIEFINQDTVTHNVDFATVPTGSNATVGYSSPNMKGGADLVRNPDYPGNIHLRMRLPLMDEGDHRGTRLHPSGTITKIRSESPKSLARAPFFLDSSGQLERFSDYLSHLPPRQIAVADRYQRTDLPPEERVGPSLGTLPVFRYHRDLTLLDSPLRCRR